MGTKLLYQPRSHKAVTRTQSFLVHLEISLPSPPVAVALSHLIATWIFSFWSLFGEFNYALKKMFIKFAESFRHLQQKSFLLVSCIIPLSFLVCLLLIFGYFKDFYFIYLQTFYLDLLTLYSFW